jgi:dienelactone hydrolase
MRVHERDVEFAVAGRLLSGRLEVPERTSGLVVLAEESGDRFEASGAHLARAFHAAGLATLRPHLRTADEELAEEWTLRDGSNIELIAHRLEVARDWLQRDDALSLLPLGYLGTGIGAAAVLVASAHQPRGVQAVVTVGGRPDLAGGFLPEVRVPTLLLVGEDDEDGSAVVRRALDALVTRKALRSVPGASHRFEEPSALEHAARLAAAWFSDCFRTVAGPGVLEWMGEQGGEA